MTYGTRDQSFINRCVCVCGGGGVFSEGGVSRKILLCKGGGAHYMKNKNIGWDVLSTQPD